MRSFSSGLWVGFVAGVVFMALMQRANDVPSLEERLLGPPAPPAPPNTPDTLASRLARQASS